jgi:lipopolysaccharide assembly protein A
MTSPQDTGGQLPPPERRGDQTAISPAPPQEPGSALPPGPRTPAPVNHRLRRTRIGGVWVGLALSAIVLLLLLIFILQNGESVGISYLGAHGHLPLGVALLLAAVAGALLVTIPASGRIIQLRRTARRHRRIDAARQAAPPQSTPAPSGQPGNQA